MKKLLIPAIVFMFFSISCSDSNKKKNKNIKHKEQIFITAPNFDPDSAFYFVKAQTDFGPRVPNTEAHRKCAQFLQNKLEEYCDVVIVQPFTTHTFDGTKINGKNIIGSFFPEKQRRVLLAAHWDSRPYADHDPNPENWRTPIDGANDGASGVGILLEIARQLHLNSPKIGIDIIFFDLEDYGEPNDDRFNYTGENWCLGSQAWAKNPHTKNYKAKYGILLDMVGGKNAMFTKEGFSRQYAPDILDKVWNRANYLGFSSYFQNKETDPILDDHFYLNKIRNIPTIDIIEWSPSSEHGFNKYWHTLNDNMDNIHKETLYVVGTVVLSVVYSEK